MVNETGKLLHLLQALGLMLAILAQELVQLMGSLFVTWFAFQVLYRTTVEQSQRWILLVFAMLLAAGWANAVGRCDFMIHRNGGSAQRIEGELGIQGHESYLAGLKGKKLALPTLDIACLLPLLFLGVIAACELFQVWKQHQARFWSIAMGCLVILAWGIVNIAKAPSWARK